MKLAYFSPLNPQRSGISDYSEELLPHLAEGAEIELFVDGFTPSNKSLCKAHQCFDYHNTPEVLERLRDYDAILYHMGNDHRYHTGIYQTSRAFPGIVVLHDFALQNFFKGVADDDRNSLIARNAEALIVHSESSRARLTVIAPAVPIAHINHHVLPEGALKESKPMRKNKGRGVEMASFGHITSEKGIELTLRVLATLRDHYQFHYTLVGQHENFDVIEIVRSYNLSDRVTVTGYVSMDEFQRRIAETDVAINLRDRTVGETSESVCRIMAAGVPCVVSNIGWFAELPDEVSIKVDMGKNADDALREQLGRLMDDATLRRRIGVNAQRYVRQEHAIEKSVKGYLDFIREVIDQRERRRFVRRVSAELAGLQTNQANETYLRGVATEIAQLTPAKIFRTKDIT